MLFETGLDADSAHMSSIWNVLKMKFGASEHTHFAIISFLGLRLYTFKPDRMSFLIRGDVCFILS